MATLAENERLAVLESQYKALQGDVTEIKADVKSLVAAQAALSLAVAVRKATDDSASETRGSVGVWVRSVVPWALMICGLLLTLINTFDIQLVSAK